jgi:hypothetical protein
MVENIGSFAKEFKRKYHINRSCKNNTIMHLLLLKMLRFMQTNNV